MGTLLIVWAMVFSGDMPGDDEPARLPELVGDTLPESLPIDAIPAGLADRPVPPDNALTPARVALGRKLFFDPALSRDRTMACASCHRPDHGFAGREARAVGVGRVVGTRNAPSILNSVYSRAFFWDGRSHSLEDQALQPIENAKELATTVPEVLERLAASAEYQRDFAAAYGEVNRDNLARAIASFERVLLTGDNRVDRFHAGQFGAITDGARKGMWLFESRGGCWRCHSGPSLSDSEFHNTGVSWGREPLDLGRFTVTGQDQDRGRFRTAPLRDVARTAPYMHDGSLASLKDVVEFYNRGGTKNPHLDPDIKPLGLTPDEVDHLVAFLEALSGRAPWDE